MLNSFVRNKNNNFKLKKELAREGGGIIFMILINFQNSTINCNLFEVKN